MKDLKTQLPIDSITQWLHCFVGNYTLEFMIIECALNNDRP